MFFFRVSGVKVERESMASPSGDEHGSQKGEQVIPVSELRTTISQMLKEALQEHEGPSSRGKETRKGRVS